MARSHAQGAATTAGHTGESLAPWEIVDSDAVEGHATWTLPRSPLQDGWGWKGQRDGQRVSSLRGIISRKMLTPLFSPPSGLGDLEKLKAAPKSTLAYCRSSVQRTA